ncbi:MAG: hypothetical protein JXB00_15950 [Bacteroidales bacterium]|nr:hypothetical protein [Bacteroidales bacterium]
MEKQWSVFYKIGAICALLAFLFMVAEIMLTALPDGTIAEFNTLQVFELYNTNRFMAMRNMGLINIFATTLALPVYFALYGLHRDKQKVAAAFALLLCVVSYAIFMADNAVFPFIHLADKYLNTSSADEKAILLAAGEALFAKGASHTPGTFPGFFLGQIAGIIVSIVIIKGKILKKSAGITGLIAFTFLLLFEILSSFFGITSRGVYFIVGVGGIFALAWYLFIAAGLFRYPNHAKD